MKKLQALVGLKITHVKKDGRYNAEIHLSNGQYIDIWTGNIITPKPAKQPKTLTDYLRSIGIDSFYIDKRVDHYRLKPRGVDKLTDAVKKINALNLPGVTCELEKFYNHRGQRAERRLIIRTQERPSLIKVKTKVK